MKKMVALVLIAGFLFSGRLGYAESFASLKPSVWTEQSSYADKTAHKLGFGLLNLTLGWTAVPNQIDKHRNTNPYTGFVEGIWLALTNTVGGALHTATFPVPVDIPLPAGGVHFN